MGLSKLNLTSMSFNNLTLVIGLITGAITAIISYVFCLYQHKKLVNCVKIEYPNETIEYAYTPLIKIVTSMQFFIGVFIGGYILPFFIFKNVVQVKMVTLNSLYIFVIIAAISFIFLLFLSCYTVVLTNKRIKGIFLYNTLKSVCFLLSEIKTINCYKNYIDIVHINNDIFPIRPFSHAKKVYDKIIYLKELEAVNND